MKTLLRYTVIIMVFLTSHLVVSQYSESDWTERDTWMPLETIFSAVQLKEGMHVADLGCHEGYLSMHLAKRIGPTGTVYSEDIREDRLDLLKDHAKSRGFKNVKVILGDYANPKLPKGVLDVVFIIDTYHEMDEYKSILNYVYKALKPGGKIVILEKLKSRVKGKSRADMTMAHSLAPKYVRNELTRAKFKVIQQLDDLGDWENDEDKVIWLMIAEKRNK